MTWVRRTLLALPVSVAALLTLLASLCRPLHLECQRIGGYCFLFGTPWSWLLDRGWFDNTHSRWVEVLIGGAVILWIPALLYSGCLWLLLYVLGFRALRDPREARVQMKDK
jgi:hypothetical protein